MSARDEILRRVRRAVEPRSDAFVPPVERGYRRTGTRSDAECLDLLTHRLVDYRARVRRCRADEVDAVIAAALADHGVRRVIVPPGLHVGWARDVEVTVDDGTLSATALDGFDGVVTASALAIAETGTIVLDCSNDQGRRAISLVPDCHVCLVHADQVVETVPQAVALLSPDRALTWISGPSATSDIELNRVEGVHGPRTLEVILIDST